ncbi:putative esterase [Bacteroidales bacterium Barb7]|nr:putative esterase [Bacteroidales bacterium Barb7]
MQRGVKLLRQLTEGLRNKMKFVCFVLLAVGLFACSPEESSRREAYFLSVSDSLWLDRASLTERLGGDDMPDALLQFLPERQVRTDAIRYRSEDPQGNAVVASGIVVYPADGVFKGVVVGQHYSIGADRESPSARMAVVESLLALFGYVVITPDYIGFGATADLPQTYIHAESTGRVTADMVFAAREYMAGKGMPVEEEMYVVGYSQGGYSALAFAKTAEEQYPDDMPLRHVFAGGGPYVPESMFNLFIEKDVLENPSTVLLAITGFDYADGLNLDYAKVFQEPLLSQYEDCVFGKKHTLSEMERLLGTDRLSDILHPDLFLPERNSEFDKIYRSLAANNLTGWTPETPVLLVHGTGDGTVPFVNAQTAYNSFKARGCTVRLIPVPGGDHRETGITFFLTVLQQLT